MNALTDSEGTEFTNSEEIQQEVLEQKRIIDQIEKHAVDNCEKLPRGFTREIEKYNMLHRRQCEALNEEREDTRMTDNIPKVNKNVNILPSGIKSNRFRT